VSNAPNRVSSHDKSDDELENTMEKRINEQNQIRKSAEQEKYDREFAQKQNIPKKLIPKRDPPTLVMTPQMKEKHAKNRPFTNKEHAEALPKFGPFMTYSNNSDLDGFQHDMLEKMGRLPNSPDNKVNRGVEKLDYTDIRNQYEGGPHFVKNSEGVKEPQEMLKGFRMYKKVGEKEGQGDPRFVS